MTSCLAPRCFSVYVAAPYSAGVELRRSLPGRIAAIGGEVSSRWLFEASGPENLWGYAREELRAIGAQNDEDLRRSDVVLLVDPTGEGRETYAEAARALEWGIPIVWFGDRGLSRWRSGVVRVDDLDQAIAVLRRMEHLHQEGFRSLLLAVLAGGGDPLGLGEHLQLRVLGRDGHPCWTGSVARHEDLMLPFRCECGAEYETRAELEEATGFAGEEVAP
jgi:hypothetical protein